MPYAWVKVDNYRCLNHLHIERLGRVNLLTGRNSVGKSCLLEAIELCGASGDGAALLKQMAERGLLREDSDTSTYGVETWPSPRIDVQGLFYGWPELVDGLQAEVATDKGGLAVCLRFPEGGASTAGDAAQPRRTGLPRIEIRRAGLEEVAKIEPWDDDPDWLIRRSERLRGYSPSQASSWRDRAVRWQVGATDINRLAAAWDSIAMLPPAQDALAALRLVHPDLEALHFPGASGHQTRSPLVKLSGLGRQVPLLALGDGVLRLLTIAIGLATTAGGILLLDEIDTGLHYSIQRELWRMVCATAARLGVQVFATTHSWDCVTAFQHAVRQEPSVEGYLHRLQAVPDRVVVTSFDNEQLAAATESDIEVRG